VWATHGIASALCGADIHSETLQLLGNVQCLPLNASRDAIIQALIRPATRPMGGGLTLRQQEVLGCLARGLSNAEIAEQLAIREDTVKAHLGTIYRKLDVKSRTGAITAYLEAR
jgi:DNA-binding NarL/FixJ family response regulator